MDKASAQTYIEQNIPVTRGMGLSVEEVSKDKVILAARLIANLNHKKTAFGGSLFTVSVLSCWIWVMNQLEAQGLTGELVIQSSETEYLHPVAQDFRGVCAGVTPAQFEKFLDTLKKKRKSRLEVSAQIEAGIHVCMKFSGKFVVIAA